MMPSQSVEIAGAVPVDILQEANGNQALAATNQATLESYVSRFGALDVILTRLDDHCRALGVFVTSTAFERERLDALPAAL